MSDRSDVEFLAIQVRNFLPGILMVRISIPLVFRDQLDHAISCLLTTIFGDRDSERCSKNEDRFRVLTEPVVLISGPNAGHPFADSFDGVAAPRHLPDA